MKNGNLDSGWGSDVGREGDRVDVFSIYKRQIYNRTWKRKYQGWPLNIWFMLLWGIAIHLRQKHKLIGPDILGGMEIVNSIRGYMQLPLRHSGGDVNQVGIWIRHLWSYGSKQADLISQKFYSNGRKIHIIFKKVTMSPVVRALGVD